jgi:hypothetical protein
MGGGSFPVASPKRHPKSPTWPKEVDFRPKKFKFYHSSREFQYSPQKNSRNKDAYYNIENQMSNISFTSSPRPAVGATSFGASGGFGAGIIVEVAGGGSCFSAKMMSHCALCHAFTSAHIDVGGQGR